MSFEFRVVEVGQLGDGERAVVEAGVGGERGGELADEVAEGGAVEPEETAGAGEEEQRVAEGDAGGDAVPGRPVCSAGASGPGAAGGSAGGAPSASASVSAVVASRIESGPTRQLP